MAMGEVEKKLARIPTKRLSAKKQPTNIHMIEKKAAPEKSLRTGAWPGCVVSIVANISASHPSPVLMMYSSNIAPPKSSKLPIGGFDH